MTAESTGIDPYEAVLADLKAKRDHIDQMIAAIEAFRGGAAPAGAQTGNQPATDGSGAYLGLSIVDATKKLLTTRRQALRTPEILASLKAGGLVLSSKEPLNVIGSVLTRHFNEVGEIVRVERGLWGLKDWYPGRNFKKASDRGENGDKGEDKPEAAPDDTPEPPRVNKWTKAASSAS